MSIASLPLQPGSASSVGFLAPDDNSTSLGHGTSVYNKSEDHLLAQSHPRRHSLTSRKLTKRRPQNITSPPPSSYSPAVTSGSRPLSWYSTLVPVELSPRPLSTSDIAVAKRSSSPYALDDAPLPVGPPVHDGPAALPFESHLLAPSYEPASLTKDRRKHRLSLRELADSERDEAIRLDTVPRVRSRPGPGTAVLIPEMHVWKRRRSMSFLCTPLLDDMPGLARKNGTLSTRSSTEALSSLALNGVVPRMPSLPPHPDKPPAVEAIASSESETTPGPKSILKAKSFSQPPLSRNPTTASGASASSSSTLVPPPSPAVTRQRSSRAASSHSHSHSAELKRGWSFAMAMSDEGVTDEVLVAELERLRRTRAKPSEGDEDDFVWMAGKRGRTGEPVGSVCSGLSDEDADSPLHSIDSTHTLVDPYMPASAAAAPERCASPVSDAEEEALWHTARRALLCCREIVRTERRYQAELAALLRGRTTTPPPPLMKQYVPALLRASQRLLKGLAEDPSAWGVATAFVACEEEVEEGMVAWAGVVGEFFAAGESGRVKAEKSREKNRELSMAKLEGVEEKLSRSGTWRNRSLSFLNRTPTRTSGPRPPLPPMPPPPVLVARATAQDKERRGKLRKSRVLDSSLLEDIEQGVEMRSPAASPARKEKQYTVRDLAIQPTQRVMRYVMLYRDLLAHTPASSPSYALVEAALKSAQRMALKCDRAQNNAAFLPHSKLSVPMPMHSASLQSTPEGNSKPWPTIERPKTMLGRFMSSSHARFSGTLF
ncbi:hypothetical protein HWV62_11081 [Athelia sp. TMB]|nr:hypothetical protein HWV62_11081 [Athelia sp. TMB]